MVNGDQSLNPLRFKASGRPPCRWAV